MPYNLDAGELWTNLEMLNISQAAAVQNTWYTVLDTAKNIRIITLSIIMTIANEDIELELTCGDTKYTAQETVNFGSWYNAYFSPSGSNRLFVTTTDYAVYRAFLIEDRKVKIRMRKTSANGAGTLTVNALIQRKQ